MADNPRSATHGGPADPHAALVTRVLAGDENAFRELFEQWFSPLVSLAYRYTGAVDTANDIVQDAFVAFWHERATWRWTGTAFGYLQLVVRRAAIKAVRRHLLEMRHGSALAADGISPTSGQPIPRGDQSVSRGELWREIVAAVDQLTPRTRAVAVLRWFEGLSRTEAAAELGISVRTVDAQLILAAKAVRARLAERGYDSAD